MSNDYINNNIKTKFRTSRHSFKPEKQKVQKEIASPVPSDGYMLPSRIFGSPVRYVQNLKKDVVTIKKGAQGKANDHELGRLNDLAMKAGSLLLAAYLFTTKPFKTSKAMEFMGAGSFLASMALWPKLFIQAPIKARTGVDIHRKYVDSFGREKMFFQDPQYVPWSLVSSEEIDKMGDKLNIPKDIPDRNAVIQDVARKTAVQGNTLWMYTAGLATPLMSALGCHYIEPVVDKKIRDINLASTQQHLENSSLTFFQNLKKNHELKKLQKYINSIANNPLDSKTIKQIADRLSDNNFTVSEIITKELTSLAESKKATFVPLNKDNLSKILSSVSSIPSNISYQLDDIVQAVGTNEINADSIADIASKLAKETAQGNPFKEKKFRNEFLNVINTLFDTQRTPKTAAISQELGKLSEIMNNLKAQQGIFDRFLTVRTRQIPGTLLGKEYNDFTNIILDALGVKSSEKLLTEDEIVSRIEDFVESDRFNDTIKKLEQKVENFGQMFNTPTLFDKMDETLSATGQVLKEANFKELAENMTGVQNPLSETLRTLGFQEGEKVTRSKLAYRLREALNDDSRKWSVVSAFERETDIGIGDNFDKLKRSIEDLVTGQPGSMKRAMRIETDMRILGAESSFLRTIQTFDILKKIKNGTLKEQLQNVVVDGQRSNLTQDELEEAIKYAKNFITKGTIVDYSDKARYMNTQSGKKIHDAVMEVLFNEQKYPTRIGTSSLSGRMQIYKNEFKNKIIDMLHYMEAPFNDRGLAERVESMQGITKHNLVGEPIVKTIENGMQSMKNSNRWLKIFLPAFLALVGITIITGTQFGKYKNTKAEEGEKING